MPSLPLCGFKFFLSSSLSQGYFPSHLPLFSSLPSLPFPKALLLPCWQAAFWVVCMPDILNLKREIKWKAAAAELRAMEADEHTHYTGKEEGK